MIEVEEKIDALTKAIEGNREDAASYNKRGKMAHQALALAYEKIGKEQDAIQDYTKAI